MTLLTCLCSLWYAQDLVAHLPLLEHLNLSSCVRVAGNLSALSESRNLQFLNLEGTAVEGEIISSTTLLLLSGFLPMNIQF